jgi:hypothetical protein
MMYNYAYRRRQDRADPRREDEQEFYVLNCGYCDGSTKHRHTKDRIIPFVEVDPKIRGEGNAIDHLYKCDECGSIRRWGLSSTRKVDPSEVRQLEAEEGTLEIEPVKV